MMPIVRPIMEENEKRASMDVLNSGALVKGKKVDELEKKIC